MNRKQIETKSKWIFLLLRPPCDKKKHSHRLNAICRAWSKFFTFVLHTHPLSRTIETIIITDMKTPSAKKKNKLWKNEDGSDIDIENYCWKLNAIFKINALCCDYLSRRHLFCCFAVCGENSSTQIFHSSFLST